MLLMFGWKLPNEVVFSKNRYFIVLHFVVSPALISYVTRSDSMAMEAYLVAKSWFDS